MQRPRRRRIGRWMAELRCRFGHVWRESRSLQGYETCARCRLRRMPPH